MGLATASAWDRAVLALRLVTADPGLGGIVLTARAGPVRTAFLEAAGSLWPDLAKVHPGIDDDQLFGGIDLNLTLSTGQLTHRSGLLERGAPLMLTMAERASPSLAARLALLLDQPGAPPLIALDEAAEPAEGVPPALSERLAFHVDLDGLSLSDIAAPDLDCHPTRLASVPEALFEQVVRVAAALGIDSLRATCLAVRAARAHAALSGHREVDDEDIEAAVLLVLAPRATQIPAEEPADQPPPPDPDQSDATAPTETAIPDDMLIAAARALLPDDLLDRIAAKARRGATGSGAGARRTGNRRGRPLPARPGTPGARARIDIVATLRKAAPWQPLRRKAQPDRPGVLIRSSDLHVKRHEVRSDRLLIFTVDASGSAAATRLAEAKGAVELMLSAAYARRDHVALIGFRRDGAEVLLAPTRSLVRTKRELAALPGGGGTPLAAGLKTALTLAVAAGGRGMTPTVALLTDGRANVALDGTPGRDRAAADATALALTLREQGIGALVIDMGARPEASLADLARAMDATYLALPRADAGRISQAMTAALEP